MRCASINKQTVYYALFSGYTEKQDTLGNYTGEVVPSYGTPVKCKMCVSAAKTEQSVEAFGNTDSYDRVITTDIYNVAFDTSTVFWIGIEPENIVNGSAIPVPHNYEVKQVARGLDRSRYIMLAVKEVKLS